MNLGSFAALRSENYLHSTRSAVLLNLQYLHWSGFLMQRSLIGSFALTEFVGFPRSRDQQFVFFNDFPLDDLALFKVQRFG
jgi:hypothetical protein